MQDGLQNGGGQLHICDMLNFDGDKTLDIGSWKGSGKGGDIKAISDGGSGKNGYDAGCARYTTCENDECGIACVHCGKQAGIHWGTQSNTGGPINGGWSDEGINAFEGWDGVFNIGGVDEVDLSKHWGKHGGGVIIADGIIGGGIMIGGDIADGGIINDGCIIPTKSWIQFGMHDGWQFEKHGGGPIIEDSNDGGGGGGDKEGDSIGAHWLQDTV